MRYDYFYGEQADQFSFIRIPKIMLTGEQFASLSIGAKVLYGVLLDRMSLSMKNQWLDEEQRVYIIYQVGEIQEDLGFSRKKAMDLLSELETFGLLEKKRRGHGLPNVLYLKSFLPKGDVRSDERGTSERANEGSRSAENSTLRESQNDTSKSQNDTSKSQNDTSKSQNDISESQNDTSHSLNDSGDVENRASDDSGDVENRASDDSGDVENGASDDSRSVENGTSSDSRSVDFGTSAEVSILGLQEVSISGPLKNKTDKNNTYKSDNIYSLSNLIVSRENVLEEADERREEMRSDDDIQACEKMIEENIGYSYLLQSYPLKRDLIREIKDLIVEIVLCQGDYFLIASNRYPAEVVKNRFRKLDCSHIEYVLECLSKNKTKVVNIKKYLLAILFNASATMDGYYTAEVNHDMAKVIG